MKNAAALLLVVALGGCATAGDALQAREAARDARDAALLMSAAGAGVVAASVGAVLVAPQKDQGTAILVAAPVALVGAAAFGTGGVVAKNVGADVE